MFAHGALGKEAVLVASLSNSVLLVIRISGRDGGRAESGGLRSWLLDWPVAGKVGAVDFAGNDRRDLSIVLPGRGEGGGRGWGGVIVCVQAALCYCGCAVRAVNNKLLALAMRGYRYKSPGSGLC